MGITGQQESIPLQLEHETAGDYSISLVLWVQLGLYSAAIGQIMVHWNCIFCYRLWYLCAGSYAFTSGYESEAWGHYSTFGYNSRSQQESNLL